MPRSWLTIAFLLSFLVLVGVLQWVQLPQYPKEVWITILLFALLGFWIFLLVRSRFGALLLCMVIGASLAFLRVSQTTHIETPESVERYAVDCDVVDCFGKDAPVISLEGIIVDEPDRRPMKTRYVVEVHEIVGAQHAVPLHTTGKILATDLAAWPRHAYGDAVRITGVIERPDMIEDFHYDRYLSRFGIYAVMYRATVETLSFGHGSPFFALLYDLKEKFERQITRLYPEPHAAFLAGLLTGSRQGIPEHLLQDFQVTGLTHIIAIILSILGSLLFFLPLQWRFFPSLIAIAFFTLFVGASPSVVRAAIMGALGLFALQVGRQKHSLIAILLAAFLMVAWNPKLLWYDAGFQLSFLAVLGITYLSPFLERPLRIFPETFAIRESLKTTLAAQLAAVPLVTLLFGKLSLIAPLANVLVALLVPFAMLVGFLGVLISFLFFPLGLFISYFSFGALELIILIAKHLADLPYASLGASGISVWWVWGYYAVLVFILLLTIHRQRSSAPPPFAAS
jgi:competence protein ComEC